MTIASEISRLQSAKADIKTAIESKGVEIGSSDTIDSYAACIDEIQTGSPIKAIEYLVVGGGGGGGTSYPGCGYPGGGGGGGEVCTFNKGIVIDSSLLEVKVGKGGLGGYCCCTSGDHTYGNGQAGNKSSIKGFIEARGGYGGCFGVYTCSCACHLQNGGNSGTGKAGGWYDVNGGGGGGGGATGDGGHGFCICNSGSCRGAGNGGVGLCGYGGGGGGGWGYFDSQVRGLGCDGGGDGSCSKTTNGCPATNCGGGGGGSRYACGGDGADGVVKICYKTDGSYGINYAIGGAKATSGDYTVHTFTNDGLFQVFDKEPQGPWINYLVVGGGGGGCGTCQPGDGYSKACGGGGGGGGAVCFGTKDSLNVGDSISITVGAGGRGWSCSSASRQMVQPLDGCQSKIELGEWNVIAPGGKKGTLYGGGDSGSGCKGACSCGVPGCYTYCICGGGGGGAGSNAPTVARYCIGSCCCPRGDGGDGLFGYGGGGGGHGNGVYCWGCGKDGGAPAIEGCCTVISCAPTNCGGGGAGSYHYKSGNASCYLTCDGACGVVDICYPCDGCIHCATGGNSCYLCGDICVHRFTSNGTFTIVS